MLGKNYIYPLFAACKGNQMTVALDFVPWLNLNHTTKTSMEPAFLI